jgi:hypothetical protein
MSLLTRIAAVFIACLLALPAAAQTARILGHDTLDFEHAPLRGQQAPPRRLAFSAFGRAFVLDVESNTALLESLDAGARASAVGIDNLFLRGKLVGDSGSWARLSRIDGRWTGGFYDGTELYLLDDAVNVADLLAVPARPGSTVIYRFGDLVLPGLLDDVVTVSAAYRPKRPRADYAAFLAHLRANLGKAAGATRELRLTVVTDTEYTAVHTTNADAVTASRVNFVDGIYSAQLGVQITATTVRNLTANGSLTATDSSALLGAFRTYMSGAEGSSIPKGGLNQLFSGKDFDGNVVGRAYLGVLCSASFGYGINQVRAANNTTALTIAHEMGHNFGAPHDGETGSACAAQTGSWLMSPSLNGSSTFSPCTLVEMADNITAATCFVDISGNVFRHGFEP